eukprot:UN26177
MLEEYETKLNDNQTLIAQLKEQKTKMEVYWQNKVMELSKKLETMTGKSFDDNEKTKQLVTQLEDVRALRRKDIEENYKLQDKIKEFEQML